VVAAASLATALLAPAAPARGADVRFRGLLDLVATGRGPAVEHNVLTRDDSAFDPYGLRLFADAVVSPRLQGFAQVVLRDATEPYVDGAYLVYTPLPARDLHVLAGKLPWAVGTWGPRTYSSKNPLVSSPLMYQHHTSLLFYEIVPDADALLGAAGTGSYGVNYFGYAEGLGMPMVDDSYWDVGVTVAGSERPLEYALGVTAGTPGWGSTEVDENSGKSLLGRVGLAPLPWLRVGVSGSVGPYLHAELDPGLPPGRTANDYDQRLVMADAELLFDRLELRAEGARNVWETPTVGDLEVESGYVEAKVATSFGAYAAGRFDVLRFGEIADSGGTHRPWDHDVTRIEAGVGYRFTRDVLAKVIVQHTTIERGGTAGDRVLSLVAAQLSVGF
jgi:hypothetical protein